MNEQTWNYQTIEVKPSFLGRHAVDNLNEVLNREGINGWELVNTLCAGPMHPIILFLKKRR